ncbi:MAG TPA: hypothetical protein DD412_02510 [Holosporales bacterium]|nr:hypothetical protein [Holosporales bacterium]
MKYRTTFTLLVAIFTTQAFSSKCELKEWELDDSPLPPSPIITYLESVFSHSDSEEFSSSITPDKARRVLKRYNLAFVWGDGKLYERPSEIFFHVSEFNHSGALFLTKSMEILSEEISEKLRKLSSLRRKLKKETDKNQCRHTKRLISRHKLKLTALYKSLGEEIEGFKDESICLLGGLIAAGEKAEAAEREKRMREVKEAGKAKVAKRAGRS